MQLFMISNLTLLEHNSVKNAILN